MIEWIVGLTLLGVAATGGAQAQAAKSSEPPVACSLNALSASERERHGELLAALLERVTDVEELKRGYRFRVDDAAPLASVAEWMSLERRCCPFFEFALEWSSKRGTTLSVTGPSGAKQLLAAMLAAREGG